MVIRVSICVAVLVVLRATHAAETECRDCDGTGKADCAACEGKGTAVIPCGECIEGKTRCGSCRDGHVMCRRCGGTGTKTQYVAGWIERGRGTVEVPCPPTLRCGRCKGSALVDCKACGKKGTMVVQCFSCQGRGKERCLPCWGTGKVGDPDPEPAADPLREERIHGGSARGEEVGVQDALDVLQEAARSASKLDQEKRAALDGLERLRARIDALARRASEEPDLRKATEHLLRRWRASHGRAVESGREFEKALSTLLSGESVRELERLATDLESGKSVARSFLEGKVASARNQRQEVAAMRGRISGLGEDLRLWEKEAGGFEIRLKNYLASKDLERKKAEDLRCAYLRVEEKIASLARKCEMPEIECELLKSASPDALCVQVTCFDEAATVSESPEDSVPSDAALARVPPFVSEVLRECPKVERVRVVFDASCLTETGLEERQSIQRFTMERRRWKELLSGKYRGEWRTLLSKSQPAPEYPRPARIPEGTWPIVALLGACFLGTAILLAVRTRMLA